MAAESRIHIAKPDIVEFFDAYPRRALRERELESLLAQQRKTWRLAAGMTTAEFAAWLIAKSFLGKVELSFGRDSDATVVYVWREASPQEVALASVSTDGSYLGYFTAASAHGLTTQNPSMLYACVEQSKKTSTRPALTQEMIDESFSKPAKESARLARYASEWSIRMINTVHSNQLGVVDEVIPQIGPRPIRITDLERTLIDIVVRPQYCGGVSEVSEAFVRARSRLSVNRLRAYLLKLGYMYPYHQAVGFYLERAGHPEEALAPLESLPRALDLPLAHGITRVGYSARWRVWYPEGFGGANAQL